MSNENRTPRKLPRPFEMHWGKDQIVEEVSCVAERHEPAIQFLQYEDGSESIRFCYYDLRGRFQRSPLMMSREEIDELRGSLAHAPRIRELLRRLVE